MYMTRELMKWFLEQESPYPGFGFSLKENADGVWIIVSLEEFAKYSGPQQENLAVWVGGLCNHVRKQGIPCYIDRVDSFDEGGNL